MLADDSLPISMLVAVAVVKRLLSSDFFMQGMSRLTGGFSACMETGWLAGWARDGLLHGHVSALVCSRLIVIRRPFRLIVLGSGVRRAWKVIEGHR